MSYLGYEIFPFRVVAPSARHAVQNQYVVRGKSYNAQDRYFNEPHVVRFSWELNIDREELARLRRFFRARIGRFGAFWITSFRDDLELVRATTPNSSTIFVKSAFRANGWGEQVRHLYIKEPNIYTKVLKIDTDTRNSEEILLLDAVLPLIERDASLAWLYLVRFANDELRIANAGAGRFKTTLEFIELQKETP